MSMFFGRLLVGGGLAILGAAVGGPALAYAGWKGGGFLATGNVLHLIPGTGGAADGIDILSSIADGADVMDIADAADLAHGAVVEFPSADAGSGGADVWADSGPLDGHGNGPVNGHGNGPTDIQGNDWGRTVQGGVPTDVWGRPS